MVAKGKKNPKSERKGTLQKHKAEHLEASRSLSINPGISFKHNLCLFNAMLHVLQSEEQQIAFSNGDRDRTGQSFLDFMETLYTRLGTLGYSLRLRKETEGYNACDMLEYLKMLKANNKIKAYKWLKMDIRKWYMHRIYQCRPNQGYIFFGYAIQSTSTVEIGKSFRFLKKQKKQKLNREHKHKWFKKVITRHKSNWPHGVGIKVVSSEGKKKFYITDNGLKKLHEYTIEKFAARLSFPFEVRVFEIQT